MNEKKIYMITFDNHEELESFAKLYIEDTKIRCVFKKKGAISIEAGEKGFLNIISNGFLPEEIIY